MSERKFYCYCDANCKYETMTKEQILSVIEQATGVASVDPDAGYISKVLESNMGQYVTFWVGTQEQYNKIAHRVTNCLYIITDEMTKAEFEKRATELIAASEEAVRKANETAGAADEAKAAAEEAKAAAAEAKEYDTLKREFNSTTTSENGAGWFKLGGNKALFYIIEIMEVETPSVRETLSVDYFSLVSGNYLRFPCGATVLGEKLDGGTIKITMTDSWRERYGITRVTAYY